jgi:mono/diheme cytochrome c family protein
LNAKSVTHLVRRAALVVTAGALPLLTACEWFTDFKRQPSLWTWEPVRCDSLGDNCDVTVPSRGNPQGSVPVSGIARAAYEVSYTPLPATVDSMSSVANPTPISAASLANGRKYFQINCAVCHGDKGMGDGPAAKYGMPGINITSALTQGRTDGYIFGMIRNGRGAMPPYNRIEEMDRWDVVNYVRALQGIVGTSVATGPLAVPGVTGRWVPGFTQSAPTRPAPFVAPSQGSAKAWYHNGETAPALNMKSPRVGPPLLDSNLYKTGIPQEIKR